VGKNKKISLLNAISIGIGGMVGGGIFAVLGLAVSMAKGGTPLAFAFAGLIALLTAYAYARLSGIYPEKGGTVDFINNVFGENIFSGGTNNLLWLSYIVMLALYASAFGSYATELFPVLEDKNSNVHLYQSAILLIALSINYLSMRLVSEIESVSVLIKLSILIVFVIIGFYGFQKNGENLEQLTPDSWESPLHLLTGGMLIFVAYEGFELIANSISDLRDRAKNTLKAYLGAVSIVIILYILIAIVTVGSLPFSEIASAQDYVLAEAAQPLLGKTGFRIITLTAMISTFSAINATILGSGRVNYEIAEENELPQFFTRQFFGKPIGFILTAILSLILVNSFDLNIISTAGSTGFLLIFTVVNFTAYRITRQNGARSWIHFSASILCAIAFFALIIQQFSDNPEAIYISLAIIGFSFLLEWMYRITSK
jgi:amino acid transporter